MLHYDSDCSTSGVDLQAAPGATGPEGVVAEVAAQSTAPTTSTIIYARGAHQRDNRPDQREARDFAEFLDHIVADRSCAKGMQYFCAASEAGPHDRPHIYPGIAHWRLARLALPRRFLPVDIDGMADPAAFDELKVFCEPYNALVYTTASHTPQSPRCRMVIELDRATDRAEGIQLGQAFKMLFEAELGAGRYTFDKSVFQAEQPCYMPPIESEIKRFEGAPIRVDELLARFPVAAKPAREQRRGFVAAGDHEAWLRDLLAGANVHDNMRNLVALWVGQGWPDEAIYAQCDVLLDRVAERRGAERVETMLKDGELDRMIEGARAKGFAPRNYAEILADCEGLTADSEIDAVRALVIEASRALDPLERDRVFRVIKDTTDYNIGALRQMAHEARDDDDPDHLDIARSLIAEVGRENLIETGSDLWKYDGKGLWRPMQDRGVNQLVQTHMDEHFPAVKKTQHLVASVAAVLRNEVYRAGHEWDVGPPDSVNCRNGEITYCDGEWKLQEHRREHYRTAQIPIDFDPTAVAPRFEQFLGEVFDVDADLKEKKRVISEMIGYTLMSHSRYERAIVLEGSGRNGKSVLLRVVEGVSGAENVSFVQPSQMGRVFQRHFLRGKLANIVTEIPQGAMLQDGEIKALTSGESSTTEGKNRDPENTRVFATFWFGTNHLPHTRDVSDAMVRRLLIVPFNRKFVHGENADPKLVDTLLGELPGILRLALDAYAGVVERGDFTMPASSIEASQKWLLSVDQIRSFVDEDCETGDGKKATADGLYRAYKDWADKAGLKSTFTRNNFSQRMEQLGFPKRREAAGNFFHGVAHPMARPPEEREMSLQEKLRKRVTFMKYQKELEEIDESLETAG